MGIFDGWFVYQYDADGDLFSDLSASEVAAGINNVVITHPTGNLNFDDTFTVDNLPGAPGTATLNFLGASADDEMFVAALYGPPDAYFIFSRNELFEEDGNAVPTRFGITMGDPVEALLCFLAGTRMATEHGEVEVERLAIGDRLLTADGDLVAVRWIGRRKVDPQFTARERGNPVCICAGALADDVPARNLLVSPDHAMLVDGLLVNARALINGETIFQVARMPAPFVYYHVEVAGHRALLAEGAPAESFIDYVGRRRFDNVAEFDALYPDREPIDEMLAPRVSAGRVLPDSIRTRLRARAAALAAAGSRFAA